MMFGWEKRKLTGPAAVVVVVLLSLTEGGLSEV
jgi:hypothetical protein